MIDEILNEIIANMRSAHPDDPYYRVRLLYDDVSKWTILSGSPLGVMPGHQELETLDAVLDASREYKRQFGKQLPAKESA